MKIDKRNWKRRYFGALLLSLPLLARGDEFGAMPGLWKTTLQAVAINGKPIGAPQVEWHCVDEEADPWVDYAGLDGASGALCKRVSFRRSATALQWRLECSAPWRLSNEGSIVFDSPQHYTGTVKISGRVMRYPVDREFKVQGERHAACTSPSD